MNILLQILDDGRITDAHGKQVSFENTVIVMTTNAGSTDASILSGFSDKPELMSEEKTHKALSAFLRPEFINRVDEVITFRSLSEADFSRIARIMISDLEKVMAEKEIALSVSEAAIDYIARKSYSVKYGARNMRRFIETEVQDRIAEEIIRTRGRLTAVSIDADENGITAVSN
jgi:ATP-dependent Clp protease ATP-binding subunit ClpA